MKLIFTLIAILSVQYSLEAQSKLIYNSPINNSVMHNPETEVILRFNNEINKQTLMKSCFNLSGSISGNHSYEYVNTTFQNTIILKPNQAFYLNEIVSLSLNKPFLFKDNSSFDTYSLSFQIRSSQQKKTVLSNEDELYFSNPKYSSTLPDHVIEINNNPIDLPIFFKNNGNTNDKFFGIINNDGSVLELFESNALGINFSLQPNGYLTLFDNPNDQFLIYDSSFNKIDSLICGNGYLTDFHELIIDNNNHSYLMSYDTQVMDMSQIVSGGNPAANVTGTIIQKLDENKNVVFQWRTWDHFQITDATIDITKPNFDYSHGNSIDVDSSGNLLVSFRNMDEITKIDGLTGSIIWRLSGTNNEFTVLNDSTMTSKQHDARFLSSNRITVFDNGSDHSTPLASAKEYTINETTKTATLVWRYNHPLEVHSARTGNVQRLSNGNTFINWGYRNDNAYPNWTEVTPNGNIVYQFRFSGGSNYSTYRAKKHSWTVPTPTQIPTKEENINPIIYPNPGNGIIAIRVPKEKNNIKAEVMDIRGQTIIVKSITNSENQFNIKSLPNGFYLIRLTINGTQSVSKYIKN